MLLSGPLPDFDPVAVIDAIEDVKAPRLLNDDELPKPFPNPERVPADDVAPNGEEKGSD